MKEIINHIRNRMFMGTIYRTKERQNTNQEFFTPSKLVNELLDKLDNDVFTNPEKTFLDPTCGDGQILGEVLIRKLENGISHEQALKTIYGADIMPDNIEETKKHLLAGHEEYRYIVDKNIVVANALNWDFSFGEEYIDEYGFVHQPMDPKDSFDSGDIEVQLNCNKKSNNFDNMFSFD